MIDNKSQKESIRGFDSYYFKTELRHPDLIGLAHYLSQFILSDDTAIALALGPATALPHGCRFSVSVLPEAPAIRLSTGSADNPVEIGMMILPGPAAGLFLCFFQLEPLLCRFPRLMRDNYLVMIVHIMAFALH